jgi:hypothetical protein
MRDGYLGNWDIKILGYCFRVNELITHLLITYHS